MPSADAVHRGGAERGVASTLWQSLDNEAKQCKQPSFCLRLGFAPAEAKKCQRRRAKPSALRNPGNAFFLPGFRNAEGFAPATAPRRGKAFRRGIAPAVRSKSGSGVGGKGVQKVVKQTPQVKNKKMCFQNIFRMNNFYFQKILKILQKKKCMIKYEKFSKIKAIEISAQAEGFAEGGAVSIYLSLVAQW